MCAKFDLSERGSRTWRDEYVYFASRKARCKLILLLFPSLQKAPKECAADKHFSAPIFKIICNIPQPCVIQYLLLFHDVCVFFFAQMKLQMKQVT